MKAKNKNLAKRLGIWALVVAAVLMIPLVTQSPWTINDYVFAGLVLFGSASAYELITRNMKNRNHRIAVGVAAVSVIVLIWAWAVA